MAGTSDAQALLLTVSADTSKALKAIDALNKRLAGVAPEMQRSAKKAVENVEREFGHINVGKALDRVFDRSRLAVIEEGAAHIGVFGSAIEELGPLGIAAAAGIGAFALSLERTEKAVQFAAGIAKLGTVIGVSTDFIQKFNFAAAQSDVEITQADEALKNLNASLGAVQAGLAKKQTVNAFAALLGVDPSKAPDILRQYKNVGDFFPVLADSITKVGNAAEQAAIAKKLGFEELLPLLKEGDTGFNALAKKAEDLGIVLSHSVIEKAKEAEDKLRALDDVMKAKANASFAEFSDTLIAIKQGFLAAEEAGLRFLAAITGTEPTSAKRMLELQAEVARLTDKSGKAKSPFFEGQIAHDRAAIAKMQKDLATPAADPSAKDKVAALVNTGTKGTDSTAALGKAALDAANAGYEALAKALAGLVTGIDEQAQAQRAAVDAALIKKLQDLDIEAAKIKADKNDTDKKSQLALIRKARIEEEDAAEAERQLIDQQAATKALEQMIAYANRIRDQYARIAANSEHMAVTAAGRNAIANAEARKAQQRELMDFRLRAENSLIGKSGSDLAKQISDNENERKAIEERQASDNAARAFDQAGPLEQYTRSVEDLNTVLQQDGVSAIRSLSSGLADAIVNARSLGEVAGNVFRQLISDVLRDVIERNVASPIASGIGSLLHVIPGFASGTASAPGGLSLVGERGPELVNLPRGAQVIPNDLLRGMSAGRGGSVNITLTQHLDASGAFDTAALQAMFHGWGKATVQAARIAVAADQGQQARNTMGRR